MFLLMGDLDAISIHCTLLFLILQGRSFHTERDLQSHLVEQTLTKQIKLQEKVERNRESDLLKKTRSGVH